MSNIQLPEIYQDYMMLQRDKPLRIRGAAPRAASVTIELDQTHITCPVLDGRFSCDFPPQPAGREKTLNFYLSEKETCASIDSKQQIIPSDEGQSLSEGKTGSGQPDLALHHISIGDIYLAAGQSNMEFFLRYDAHWNDTKQLPHNPDIHMYNCPQIAYEGQVKNLPDSGHWFQEGDPAWAVFSAPGYSFARTLQPELGIPIGIIGCNWGGTPACAWMDEQSLSQPPLDIFQKEYEAAVSACSPEELTRLSLEALEFEDSYRHQLEWRAVMYGLTLAEQQLWMQEHKKDPVLPMGPYHYYRPAGLYHTMLEKLAPFSLKGILWYQGESDAGHSDIYDQTMAALIACFRRTWQDEALPFLFVQLAPFGRWLDCTNDGYAKIRQQQELTAKTVPGTAMISIMDLGMYEDIHPKFKMEVGRRLALLAEEKIYGRPGLKESPEFVSAVREDTQIILHFSHTVTALHGQSPRDTLPLLEDTLPDAGNKCSAANFLITCEGQTIPIRSFQFSGSQIILPLPADLPPVSLDISYAEMDFCEAAIWNEAGLPLKPFHCHLA